ncbi:hypothetical protein KCP69_01790 [Salmonella enterica subsp. enterica]|nr:hypothetical protein KCP69_01790 [Salmonella enterica subsp. enterica]
MLNLISTLPSATWPSWRRTKRKTGAGCTGHCAAPAMLELSFSRCLGSCSGCYRRSMPLLMTNNITGC